MFTLAKVLEGKLSKNRIILVPATYKGKSDDVILNTRLPKAYKVVIVLATEEAEELIVSADNDTDIGLVYFIYLFTLSTAEKFILIEALLAYSLMLYIVKILGVDVVASSMPLMIIVGAEIVIPK